MEGDRQILIKLLQERASKYFRITQFDIVRFLGAPGDTVEGCLWKTEQDNSIFILSGTSKCHILYAFLSKKVGFNSASSSAGCTAESNSVLSVAIIVTVRMLSLLLCHRNPLFYHLVSPFPLFFPQGESILIMML